MEIRYASISEFQKMDAETMDEGVPASLLMENAGNEMGRLVLDAFPQKRFYIFVGPGNNGGDALVVARYLSKHRQSIHLFCVGELENKNTLWREKYELLCHFPFEIHWEVEKNISREWENDDDGVVVDGLFGTGLARPIEDRLANLIKSMNMAKRKIALDIPSGLPQSLDGSAVYEADMVISVQAAKDIFLWPWYAKYCGEIRVVSIDFLPRIVEKYTKGIDCLDEKRDPDKTSYEHKYSRGRSVILAGSKKYPGAAILATQAANRFGTPYVQSMLPGVDEMDSRLPSEVVSLDCQEHVFLHPTLLSHHRQVINEAGHVLFGPGVDRQAETTDFLIDLLASDPKRIVIDADGLWHVERISKEFAKLSRDHEVVLTPHLGEFANLINLTTDDVKRDLFYALDLARQKYGCSVLMKDAYMYFWGMCKKSYYPRPNRYLSKAGSGDILSGILLSQLSYYDNFEDAISQGVLRYQARAEDIIQKNGEMAPIHFMVD